MLPTRADQILAFHALKYVFKVINLTFYAPLARTGFPFHALKSIFSIINKTISAPHSCGPTFAVSRLKIRVQGQILDTLCSLRVAPIFPFHSLNPCFWS